MVQVRKKTRVEKILLADDLYILWRDGHESRYDFLHCEMHAPAPVASTKLQDKKHWTPAALQKIFMP